MTVEELRPILDMYITGVSCGVLLSVIPVVIGEIINLLLKIMKGGV